MMKRFVFGVVVFGLSLTFLVLGTQTAHAVVNNDAHLPASAISPTGDITNDMACINPDDGETYGHGQHEWISDDSDSRATTVTVPDTASSVGLKMNVLSRNCDSIIDGSGNITNKTLKLTRMSILSASVSTGSLSGLSGEEVTLTYDHSYTNNWRYIKEPSSPYIPYNEAFTLNGIGGLPVGTHTITITANVRLIHRYDSSTYRCVGGPDGPPYPTSLGDSLCNTHNIIFTVQVKVISTDDLPDVEITAAECGKIRGFAKDPDSNVKLNVSLYRYTGSVATKIDDMIANLPSTSSSSPYDGYVFEFNPGNSFIEDYWDMYEHDYEVRVRSVDEDGDPISGSSYIVIDREGMTNDPCAEIECGTATFAPQSPQPDENFAATTSFNLVNQGSQAGEDPHGYKLRYDIVLNISTDAAGDNPLPGFPVTSDRALAPDELSRTFEGLNIATAGSYYVRYRVRVWNPGATGTITSRSILCSDDEPTATIAYKPFVRFYGEDVFAGGAFADAGGECKDPYKSDASILTWKDTLPDSTPSDLSDNPIAASSVQFAAYALGVVDQFHSAGMRSGAAIPTNVTSGLVFGNFNGGVKEPIGDFSSWPCVEDFFAAKPSSATVYPDNWAGLPSVNSGKNTYYVDGDIQINHNIALADYSSISSIPSLYVFVEGDMFIDPNVSRVDGVYFVKGTVYTCSDGPQSTSDDFPDTLYDICANANLRFNGAIVANKVVFERANGTLAESAINESLSSSTAGNISEAFSFMPEIYMTNGISTDGSVGSQYDYITSLPPIL